MQGGKRGNLYVRIHIDIPKKLTSEQKDLIRNLAQSGL
jgi:DnaJ-class molecular chaperone